MLVAFKPRVQRHHPHDFAGPWTRLTIPSSIRIMPVVPPRLVAAARMDPTLATLIKHGGPLTRERWMDLNYPGGPPKPWCVEHELAVPEFWRNPDKVEAEEA